MKGEALKGFLDLLLLSVLSSGPAHGYAIIEALNDKSCGAFNLPEGTIYPALHRLERNGMIASQWSEAPETGRKRRVYELMMLGRITLDLYRQDWKQFAEGINAVLEEANASCSR